MKMRRFCAVLLILFCAVQGRMALPARASESNVVDLVDNGDFDRCFSDGSPGAWWYSDKTGMQVQSAGGWEDSAYLMQSSTSSNYAGQSVGGILGGSTYTFSAYVRTAYPAVPVLKIEWYALQDDGDVTFVSNTEHVFYDAEKTWKTVTLTVEAPQGADKGTVLIRKNGSGAVCWDAVRLTGAYSPKKRASTDMKPAVSGTEECILNGGFEETKDGEAVSWAKSGTQYFSLETVMPFSGNNSMKLENNDKTVSPWLRQVYTAVEEGSLYQLSFWASSFLSEGSFAIKMEFYNSTACSSATWMQDNIAQACGNTNGLWKQIVIPIRMPENCKSIAVYPRLYSAIGRVYLDDISLVKTETRSPVSLTTDSIFYYSDRQGSGTAVIEKTAYYTDENIASVKFSFLGTDKAVKKTETVSFTGSKASFRFPLSLLHTEKQEFTVKAEVFSAEGVGVLEKSVPVYKYPRPAILDQNGICRMDGEVFTPVISYHHHPNDYAKAVEMGVNVVQSYGMSGTAILEEAAKYNIKVLMILYDGMKPAGHPDNIEKTKAMVAEVKDHPALFGYAVMDEPYFNYTAPEEWLHASYRAIRDLDDTHPVYICENTRDFLTVSQKYADVLAVDPYIGSAADQRRTLVYDMIDFSVNNAEPGKAIYALLQAFEFGGYFPTGEELRHQLYQAFMAGAKGAGYYCFAEAKAGLDLDETEVWDSICDFAEQELASAAYGFSQNNPCTKIQGDAVDAAFWREGDKTELLLLNKTEAVQSGTLQITDLPENADVQEILGDGVGTLNGTAFSYQINGGAAVRFTLCETASPWNGNLLFGSSAEALSVVEKTVYNLREGERYALTFAAMCSNAEAAPRVRLEFSNTANTSTNTVFYARAVLDGIGANPAYGTTEWQQYEVTFRVPEGADTVTFLLGNVSGGAYASPAIRRERKGIAFYKDAEVTETMCRVQETVSGGAVTKLYYLASVRGIAAETSSGADGVLYRVHEAKEKAKLFVPMYTETSDGKRTLLTAEIRFMEKGGYACVLQPLPAGRISTYIKPLLLTENMHPLGISEAYNIE